MTVNARGFDRQAYWVVLAWLLGIAVVGVVAVIRVQVAHAYWLELAVLIWLAPLALYDLWRREVPHMACVAVPCLAALLSTFAAGAWQLGTVAVLVIAASERSAIRHARVRHWLFGAGLCLSSLLALASREVAPGAIAVVGFWLTYELGWWAGADALVAITLALLWPDIRLLLMLAAAHLGVAPAVWLARKWSAARGSIATSRGRSGQPPGAGRGSVLPGLPVIALAVILLMVARLMGQAPL